MAKTFNIECKTGSITWGPIEGDYLHFEVNSDDLRARTRCYLYTDKQELIKFFKQLSQDWKGFEGVRVWVSLEDDLQFEAAHDKKGEILLKITMGNIASLNTEWKVISNMRLEPGQLEKLSHNIALL